MQNKLIRLFLQENHSSWILLSRMICPTNSPPKKYFIYEREGIIFTIIVININRELLMSIVDLMHQFSKCPHSYFPKVP